MKFFCYILVSILIRSSVLADFHVVLDPGHGGNDTGATRDAFVESKIVLQIATRVKQQLDLHPGLKTTLTRADDSGLSLKNRVILANKLHADLFVSLHANTSSSEYVNGMEFYFNSPAPLVATEAKIGESPLPVSNSEVIEKIKTDFRYYEKTEKSLMLTRSFREKSTESDQKSIIRRAPFYVIDNTTMPSILIELGFISNRREAKKLTSQTYQDEMARLLASAILKYKEKSDKLSTL